MRTIKYYIFLSLVVLMAAISPTTTYANQSTETEQLIVEGNNLITPMSLGSTTGTAYAYYSSSSSIPTSKYVVKYVGGIKFSGYIPLQSATRLSNGTYQCYYEGTI